MSRKIAEILFDKVIVVITDTLAIAAIFTGSVVASAQKDLIAITDQTASNPRILVMDYAQKDWSPANSSAVVWTWKPADSGMSASGWTLPNDARLRNNKVWGGQWMATLSGGGLLAVVSYPGKVKKWSTVIPKADNVHGIELLPDGNVAIASSHGSYVRIYTSSQGPTSRGHSADFPLNQAHNVLWDPERKVLWALGDSGPPATKGRLVGLRVGGSAAAPTLSLAVDVEIDNAGGHDVEPVYGDTNSLYLTTGAKTWKYDKAKNKISLFQDGVCCRKSINMQLSTNEVVETTPKPGSPCPHNGTWCTEVVEFHLPTAPFTLTTTRIRTGAAIYRTRVWVPDYQ